MNPAIQVEGLSKRYQIGRVQKRFGTSRANWFRRDPQTQELWALRNVSFEIKPGEVTGIIGRNGAGKTTLLKILSRITEPTEGCARIHGRAASLLEIGSGFHPELTGRENIYLNGAILGMKKREIDRKFDEIVAFSEIEKFIDTTLKHYSSGMYIRLAFAVAAHLDPEILLVDEILAVGDATFQKKCLTKMEHAAGEGRTVLLVSHNMGAILQLCERSLWINNGQLQSDGPSKVLIEQYLEDSFSRTGTEDRKSAAAGIAETTAFYDEVRLLNLTGLESRAFLSGSAMLVEARVRVNQDFVAADCRLEISTASGIPVVDISSKILGQCPLQLSDGAVVRWRFNELRLTPGKFFINLRIRDLEKHQPFDFVNNAISFEVLSSDVYGFGEPVSHRHGLTYMPVTLEVQPALANKI